jgi:hypothetical protein
LRFITIAPAPTAPEGQVRFVDCTGVGVDDCQFGIKSDDLGMPGLAAVRIDNTGAPAGPVVEPAAAPVEVSLLKLTRVRDCQFLLNGQGPLSGIELHGVSWAQLTNNTFQMQVLGGRYGIEVAEASRGVQVLDNLIVSQSPDPAQPEAAALGGIHIGSGCHSTVARDNQIYGGAGLGIELGSADPDHMALGDLKSVWLLHNRIKGMALSGIGVPPVIAAELSQGVVTDDLTIADNQIENCAWGLTPRSEFQGRSYRAAGGVALWSGARISLLDNGLSENGHLAETAVASAPHPVGGVVVLFAGAGLLVARNQIRNNFSLADKDPEGALNGPVSLSLPAAMVSSEAEGALTVIHNEVLAPRGMAFICQAQGGGPLRVSANHLDSAYVEPGVRLALPDGSVQFNGNQVVSRLPATISGPVDIRARHVTFSANQCESRKALPKGFHVLLMGESVTATGNHCLETEKNEGIRSLLIRSFSGSKTLTAVGNVTTNGVELDPPNPATDIANVTGVLV